MMPPRFTGRSSSANSSIETIPVLRNCLRQLGRRRLNLTADELMRYLDSRLVSGRHGDLLVLRKFLLLLFGV